MFRSLRARWCAPLPTIISTLDTNYLSFFGIPPVCDFVLSALTLTAFRDRCVAAAAVALLVRRRGILLIIASDWIKRLYIYFINLYIYCMAFRERRGEPQQYP